MHCEDGGSPFPWGVHREELERGRAAGPIYGGGQLGFQIEKHPPTWRSPSKNDCCTFSCTRRGALKPLRVPPFFRPVPPPGFGLTHSLNATMLFFFFRSGAPPASHQVLLFFGVFPATAGPEAGVEGPARDTFGTLLRYFLDTRARVRGTASALSAFLSTASKRGGWACYRMHRSRGPGGGAWGTAWAWVWPSLSSA